MDKEYLPLRTQDSFILSADAFFIANARSTEMAAELVNICNAHYDLLEALEDLVTLIDFVANEYDLSKMSETKAARAAIQKAKGEDQ